MSCGKRSSRFREIKFTAATPWIAIFSGGLLAGTFDITQAFIGFGLVGAKPFKILQHIAGGILGPRTFEMGWASAALGLTCHFTIATTAAGIFYFVSRKLRLLLEYPVICGLLYGESVFLFMYFVVIRLNVTTSARALRRWVC